VSARRQLGYVPEAADPPGYLRVDDLLALVAALKDADPLDAAVRERLGVDLLAHQRIERLSLGERRRACLAAALVGDPAVLVLDEPSNGLDSQGAQTLVEILSEQRDAGATILLATHDHDLIAALSDQHLRLVNGRLAP
jgi:ABC-type multidrug transport system ATPase subunit